MTKDEALAAIEKGEKVAHVSFASDEWLKKSGNGYEFEDGIQCSKMEFWRYRTDAGWLNGWHIYEVK